MIKRREFIRQAGFIAAGLALLRPSALTAVPAFGPGKTGIQLYTLRSELKKGTVKQVLGKVAASGYKEVETYGYTPEAGFWGMSAKEFKDVLKTHGLTSPSGHYGADAFIAKKGTKDQILPLIEGAAMAGQSYFTVPWLAPELRTAADDYKLIAEKLNQAIGLCKEAGLELAYHNHDFEFVDFNGTTGMEILLEQSEVKIELDIYWSVYAEKDPMNLFKRYPGRFPMWHVKDMDRANRTQNTEVGKGSIDYKSIFTFADQAGLKHYFVEQENNYAPDIYSSIASSASFIRQSIR